MLRKLILSCVAAFAFAAFALPAVASAANKPTLRDSNPVAKGAKFFGTNTGDFIFYDTKTEIKQFTCTKALLTGEVTKNENDTVEGRLTTLDISGTGTINKDNNLNECTDSFGGGFAMTFTRTPLVLSSTPAMATDEFQVTGTGGNIRFDLVDTTVGTCEYELTGTLKGDFTTGGTQTTLTIRDTQAGSGAKLIAGGFFCPSSGALGLKITLETEDGTPVWIESTP
jgi:hypothetical protein